jgi:RNA polymerase sigma-70 factor (sigma-E family)
VVTGDIDERTITDSSACHPLLLLVRLPVVEDVTVMTSRAPPHQGVRPDDALLAQLFAREATSLVRMARFFVDDRTAAEDLVQEAFIRLARTLHRLRDPAAATGYLRSIVLNLARDHNRRGLMSLRHQPPAAPEPASVEDQVSDRDDARRMVAELRSLPRRQRDCLVLRYYMDLSVADIAATLGLSANSVKTHLQRGLQTLEDRLVGTTDATTRRRRQGSGVPR